MVRPHRAGSALVAVLLLAGCGAGATASAPTWRPKPSFSGEGNNPANPQPAQPGAPSGPSGSTPTTPSPGASGASKQDPAVVATRLAAPTGIAILPDNTALVGERTTGRIVRVQPEAGQPVRTVRTIPGLSTVGGGGLLDLALSPNYAEDNLIFGYVTTKTDNRVIAFTLTGPITPVLTGIPRGASDNAGRIAFGADGNLYVGTGDAGRPSAAANLTSLAGKVLRVTDIGAPAPGNPRRGSRVYTSGQRDVEGLCGVSNSPLIFETESRPADASDPINLLESGASYGWPSQDAQYHEPEAQVPDGSRSPGGCAVLNGRLYVTSLDGQSLLSARIVVTGPSRTIGAFTVLLHKRYGRLRTVVAAADGALWLTTSNRDGQGHPIADDERVLRIIPSGGTGNKPT